MISKNIINHWCEYFDVLRFIELDSTNTRALILAKNNINRNSIILTNKQTKGRGRNNKSWISKIGNFHGTILLNNNFSYQKNSLLLFIASLALAQSIEYILVKHNKLNKNKIQIKWPNDILINNKKIAGILIETMNIDNKIYIAIGIGVNLTYHPDIQNNNYQTTNLSEFGIIISTSEFLHYFMNLFYPHLQKWQYCDKFDTVKEKWLNYAYKLNQKITINYNDQNFTGIFKEINNKGEIVIQDLHQDKMINFNNGIIF